MIIYNLEGVLFSGDISGDISRDILETKVSLSLDTIDNIIYSHVPQSDWCKKLTDCGYCEIIVIEVKIPNKTNSPLYKISEDLRKVNKKILLGDYEDAVANCRKILEEIAENWPNLQKVIKESEVEKSEEKWSQELRVFKYYIRLKRITHLAAHSDSGIDTKPKWDRKVATMITIATFSLLQWLEDS